LPKRTNWFYMAGDVRKYYVAGNVKYNRLMLIDHYQIKTPKKLKNYLKVYIPLVLNIANSFDINLTEKQFEGDHLGLQVISEYEFDNANCTLLEYAKLIHDSVIHNRRNRVYEFNNPIVVDGISVPRIEIFEPKPGADISKLKPGVEHIAFMTNEYEKLLSSFERNSLPIDKKKVFEDGSKFFKTKLVNLVEIEFRNAFLGVSD